MYRFVIAAALLLPSPALADAFTYAGTLGKAHIVVEFTSDPQKPQAAIAGRYFYVNKGIDIPLDAATGKPGELALAEEAQQ